MCDKVICATAHRFAYFKTMEDIETLVAGDQLFT